MRAYEFVLDSFEELMLSAVEGSWTVDEGSSAVTVATSGILDQSLANKKDVVEKKLLDRFIEFKKNTPLERYGASDTHFIGTGPLAKAIPKLRHAHLTQDTSVFYTLEGRDPIVLKIYGVFNHKESGTSTPPNVKKQKQLANILKQQTV